jgi:hypothetical protein
VSECDREAPIMGRSRPTGGCCAVGKKILRFTCFYKRGGDLMRLKYVAILKNEVLFCLQQDSRDTVFCAILAQEL